MVALEEKELSESKRPPATMWRRRQNSCSEHGANGAIKFSSIEDPWQPLLWATQEIFNGYQENFMCESPENRQEKERIWKV